MKAVTLTIDLIILIIVAVIIIAVVSILLRQGTWKDVEEFESRKLFIDGCNQLINVYNCDDRKIRNITIDGKTLLDVCGLLFETRITQQECAKRCGCP